MATGRIQLRVVNGRREPFDKKAQLLVTARDGTPKTVVRDFFPGREEIDLPPLEVRDNFADRYTVLVSTKDHADGGFTPVTIKAGAAATLDLMLVPRTKDFQFDPFAGLGPDLTAFLEGDAGGGRVRYDRLSQDAKPALACLLNITTALEQLTLTSFEDLDEKPLKSFMKLDRDPSQDRIFAWADSRLLTQIEKTVDAKGGNGVSRIEPAPAGLHKGASKSFKQTDFGEANVQFSFHETDPEPRSIKGVKCFLVDVDIDYFQDTAAHLLGEVFPNKLKSLIFGKHSSKSLTDPRTVYGLRWTAGKRRQQEFKPPYVIA
jgi:hypothetical protein